MNNIDLNKAMFHADYGALRTSDFVKFSDREKERATTLAVPGGIFSFHASLDFSAAVEFEAFKSVFCAETDLLFIYSASAFSTVIGSSEFS